MLNIVAPIPKPDEPVNNRAKRASKPADMIQCPRWGGREVVETVLGAILVAGKLKGGTRTLICVGCLLKGERVLLG